MSNPPCDNGAEMLVHLILQDFSLFFISSAPGWESMREKKKNGRHFTKEISASCFPQICYHKIEEITENNPLGKTFLLRMKSKIILQYYLKSYCYHYTSVLLCINTVFKESHFISKLIVEIITVSKHICQNYPIFTNVLHYLFCIVYI